ncbi:hypothetical protein [Octadecabacter antarcticus]|uniref:hypothetical protein n=1 Tax=Octadecabacter antarcticus TaxID=1217908 RepID=UPI001C310924|nr:hypothetical protein [Octadecabacter antarcticus]
MFRQLSASVRKDTESYLNGDTDAQDYAVRLSYRGNALVGNLHVPHGGGGSLLFPLTVRRRFPF